MSILRNSRNYILQKKRNLFLQDILLVVAIIATAIVAYLSVGRQLYDQAWQSGIMIGVVPASRLAVVEHYAVSGEWLSRAGDQAPDEREKAMVAWLDEIEDGAAHTKIAIPWMKSKKDPRIMSIRPAVYKKPDAQNILWLCGFRPPPESVQVFGENRTTIPREASALLCH